MGFQDLGPPWVGRGPPGAGGALWHGFEIRLSIAKQAMKK